MKTACRRSYRTLYSGIFSIPRLELPTVVVVARDAPVRSRYLGIYLGCGILDAAEVQRDLERRNYRMSTETDPRTAGLAVL